MAATGADAAEAQPAARPEIPAPLVLAALSAFVVALVVRLGFVIDARASPFLDHRLIDEQDYHNLAQAYLRGTWPGSEALFRPPLYPLLLAEIYRFAGSDVWTVRLTQAGLGALTAPLAVCVGARVLGSVRLGLAAGLVVAACGTLVYYDVQLLAASLDALLLLATVALVLRAEATARGRDWAIAGAVAGLSAANRGSMVFLLLAFAAWALARGEPRASRRQVLRHLGILAAAFATVVSPIAWHNARNDERPEASYAPAAPRAPGAVASVPATVARLALGRCAPLGWASGINLYIGNDADVAALNDDANVAHFDWFNDLSAEPWRHGAASAHEHSGWFAARTRERVVAGPARWLTLVGRKVLEVVNGYEIPRGTSPYAERAYSHVLSLLLWDSPLCFPSGLLLPLGIAGAWTLRANRRALLLAVVTGTQFAFVVAFFVTARYRAPALPLAAILATGFVGQAVQRARNKTLSPRSAATGAAAMALLLACTNVPLPGRSFTRSAIEEYDVADELAHEGKGAEAMAHVRAAIAIAPGFAHAHVYLGFLYQASARLDDAVAEYEAALRIDPGDALALDNLGGVLLARNDAAGAERAFRSAAAANPTLSTPRLSLGTLYLSRGDAKSALPWLEEAQRLAPGDTRTRAALEEARRKSRGD